MLKRIKVNQLMVGMHVKEFCGSWMEHPCWCTAYILADAEDIAAILASSIQEVWIDCAKGLDVATGETAVSEAESEAQVEAELNPPQIIGEQRQITPVSAAAEFTRTKYLSPIFMRC